MEDYDLLICDVDGTVCEDLKPIHENAVNAICGKCKDVAFISGTGLDELIRMLSPLIDKEINVFIMANSGSVIWSKSGIVFEKEIIPEIDIQTLSSAFEESLSRNGIESMSDDVFINKGQQLTVSCIGRSADCGKKREFDESGEIRKRVIMEAISILHDEYLDKYSMVIGGTTSIDIMQKNQNKRSGIENFLSIFNYKNPVYFGDQFGDHGNDRVVTEILPCIEVRCVDDFIEKLSCIK